MSLTWSYRGNTLLIVATVTLSLFPFCVFGGVGGSVVGKNGRHDVEIRTVQQCRQALIYS